MILGLAVLAAGSTRLSGGLLLTAFAGYQWLLYSGY
jgi:hypothetical protein